MKCELELTGGEDGAASGMELDTFDLVLEKAFADHCGGLELHLPSPSS
jgi:hypothetical protein